VKLSTSVLAATVLPATLFAYPGFGGGKGLFRIQNALVAENPGLIVSAHALTRSAGFPKAADAPNSSGRIADVVAPELSYVPIASQRVGLELFGAWGGVFQAPTSPATDEFIWGPHDLKAGAKLSIPVIPVLKLGGTASYTFMSRETKAGWEVLDPTAIPPSTGLSWTGLATLQFQDFTSTAPNLILNLGRQVNKLEPCEAETRYGAAVELQGAGFALFAEGVSRQPDKLPDGRRNKEVLDTKFGHVHLTPGIAIGSPASAFLKVGYTFSFGGESLDRRRPNELMVGLGLATSLGSRRRREYGRIVGVVSDAGTSAPLAASVTFPDHPQLGTLATDPSTGAFKKAEVPTGAVTVEARAAGYESRTVPLMVESRRATKATITLTRAVSPVAVTGRVSDRKTGAALAATVLVPEADSAVFKTDSTTGAYKAPLKPGDYALVVESPGYLKQTAWILVERDRPLARDFQLVSNWMAITLHGIYFDFDKAAIKPESRPALEDAARILNENPTIRVEIQGHTDNRGSDEYNVGLSERRAQAVVNYLVQNLGIVSGRLNTIGYGEFRPVADNETEAGRALNRRVEFVVLGPAEQE